MSPDSLGLVSLQLRSFRTGLPAARGGTGRGSTPSVRWVPPTNVFETDAGTVVQVEVAGCAPEALDVRWRGRELVVSGRRQLAPLAGCRACSQLESAMGPFETAVRLDERVDPAASGVSYRDGLVTVLVPWRSGA